MSTITFKFPSGFPSIEERLNLILNSLLLHPIIIFNNEKTEMVLKMDSISNHLHEIIVVVSTAYPVIGITYVK